MAVGTSHRHLGEPDRLDRVVAALFALHRREAREIIEAGGVFLDGRRARRQSAPVPTGAELRCVREAAALAVVAQTAEEPRILWQDSTILVVWKPAGMPVEPTQQAAAGTLVEWLRRSGRRPTFHQRLDRDAAGLLVGVLDPRGNAPMARALAAGAVERRYEAVVVGRMEGDGGRWVHRARHQGVKRWAEPWVEPIPAPPWPPDLMVARWRVVEREGEGTRIQVELETGRTHQIRLQAAAVGHPVVGDVLYGRRGAGGLRLEAVEIAFPHPRHGRPMRFTRPEEPGSGSEPAAEEVREQPLGDGGEAEHRSEGEMGRSVPSPNRDDPDPDDTAHDARPEEDSR